MMRSYDCPNCQTKLIPITYSYLEYSDKISETFVCEKCHYTQDYDWNLIMKYKKEDQKYENPKVNILTMDNMITNKVERKNLESITFIRPKKVEVDFSAIYGLDKHKKLINMFLNQKHTDKLIHILLESPPSSAKTSILEQIATKSNISRWCKFVNATMLTKSGFYEVLESHRFGWLLIDEIDKLDKEHQPIFLDMLENNRVTVDKFNLHKDFKVDLQVVATSNDSSKLIDPLLSRFNILVIKPYTKKEIYNIGKRIMLDRYKIDPSLAEYSIQKFLSIPNIYIRQIRDFCQLGIKTKEQVDEYFNNTDGTLKLS